MPTVAPSLQERIRLLSQIDIFEPLSAKDIEELDGRLSDIQLEPGEMFYLPEEHGGKVYLLQQGRVRVYRMTPDGRELTLAVIRSGTLFGETALTTKHRQGDYVEAMEPSVVSVMWLEDLERLIMEKPQVGVRITHLFSERLAEYEARLEDVTLKDVSARLAGTILRLANSEGVVTSHNELKIPTHYTHCHLGTMIAVQREAVTRAFARLQDEGAVELRRRLIYVTDVQALRHFAGYGGNGEVRTP